MLKTETSNARHRIRIYPTEDQTAQYRIDMEACRVVYNLCLAMARWNYENLLDYPGHAGFNRALTQWKRDTGWSLATTASTSALQHATLFADKAFRAFFRGLKGGPAGAPAFKKFGAVQSVSYPLGNGHCTWAPEAGLLRTPKTKTPLVIKWDRRGPPQNAKTVTILHDAAGRWFASFTCRREPKPLPPTGRDVGLDAGVKQTLTAQFGHYAQAPSAPLTPEQQRRFLRLQRKQSRQKHGSAGWMKTKAQIGRYHVRITDVRTAWQNKVSKQIVDSFDTIVVEDLKIQKMLQKKTETRRGAARRKLNAALSASAIGALYAKVEYKAAWAGRTFVRVPAAYTSQTCSACGAIDAENRVSRDDFVCQSCGHAECADTNAAKNILVAGLIRSLPL